LCCSNTAGPIYATKINKKSFAVAIHVGIATHYQKTNDNEQKTIMTNFTATTATKGCAKNTAVSNSNNIDEHDDNIIALIDWKLSIIYKITVFHCAFMLIWTIVSNFFPDHWETNMEGKGYLPHQLFSKYEGHPLVFATHITPAMFWVICIPLQFHPNIRRAYPKYHRYLGRAFIGTSCLMMVGVFIILKRKLLFEHYVNSNHHTNEEETFVIVKIPGMNFSVTDASMVVVTVPFLVTAWKAVVFAQQKDYFQHQIWVIRHCGWGLWVVSQRILIATIFLPICLALYGPNGGFGPKGRYHSFFWSGVAGIVVAVSLAEYAIRLLRQKKQHQQQQRRKLLPAKTSVEEVTK